jgi:hypothetical protein
MKKTLAEWINDWNLNRRNFSIKTSATTINFDRTGCNFSYNMTGLGLLSVYELIQEPVDFLTAVKAYSEGKTIRSEYAGHRWFYIPREDGNGWITNSNDNPVGKEEILEGRWFVEE